MTASMCASTSAYGEGYGEREGWEKFVCDKSDESTLKWIHYDRSPNCEIICIGYVASLVLWILYYVINLIVYFLIPPSHTFSLWLGMWALLTSTVHKEQEVFSTVWALCLMKSTSLASAKKDGQDEYLGLISWQKPKIFQPLCYCHTISISSTFDDLKWCTCHCIVAIYMASNIAST